MLSATHHLPNLILKSTMKPRRQAFFKAPEVFTGEVLSGFESITFVFLVFRCEEEVENGNFSLYIYPLDVEPAAMLHEENKQYTVKRSEPRYNRDILIYSLISSLLRELHGTHSLPLL